VEDDAVHTLHNQSSLYRSANGHQQVVEHYNRTLESMDLPYDSHCVETHFGATHVIICGNPEGKPVVLWHGQNANATTWARWIPHLASDYRIYALDAIGGMGKSAPVQLSRKGPAYGEWAAEVLEGLKLHKSNLVGASNGGWLILKLGSVAPELIGTAVLMSSAGFASVRLKLVFQIVIRSIHKDSRVIAERLVELLSPPDLPPDPFYVEFFELILRSKFKGEQVAPRLPDEEIKKLAAPVYLLMGQYERSFNPYKALARGLDLLPNVTAAEVVPGVGHSMEHRQPDWVINRVLEYLKRYAV
jgi:pimeloyl-ACP methyl ester carboxylesterase